MVERRTSRRGFLRIGGTALAGVLGGAPASWAARELGILTAVNYAPTSDAKLDELGKRFGKAAGVNVRINHVQSVQMPAKLSSELMARSGHDIMTLEMHYPWLFQPGLVDVSDIAGELARKHGEWYPLLREHAQVKGQWLGIPLLYTSFPRRGRICSAPAASSRSSAIRSDLPSARPRTR
jgi:ABC-type glycerol-3-phosphate transport system substrate-binding protein